jgi:hypothetical protein
MVSRTYERIAIVVAVLALVGCASSATPTLTAEPTATLQSTQADTLIAPQLNGTLTLELKVPQAVGEYETLDGLDVVVTNTGRTTRTLHYFGPYLTYEIVGPDGGLVWDVVAGSSYPVISQNLHPGDSVRLSALESAGRDSWDLRDRQGYPVAPGTYRVRATVTVTLDDEDLDERHFLKTPTLPIRVDTADLPAIAKQVRLELTAPPEATVGDPIAMDMRISNLGDVPLAFRWSSSSAVPTPNYLDINVFREDTPTWYAMAGHGISGDGVEELAPGESLLVSSLFEGYGEPWMWDLHGHCGDVHFSRCVRPVAPGDYTVRGVVNVAPADSVDALDVHWVPVTVEQPLVVLQP